MLWSLSPSESRTSKSLTIPSSLVKMKSSVLAFWWSLCLVGSATCWKGKASLVLSRNCASGAVQFTGSGVGGIILPSQTREVEVSHHEDVRCSLILGTAE